jgi:hypothetical protein
MIGILNNLFYCTRHRSNAPCRQRSSSHQAPGTLLAMRNGAKSFHNNNNEASKKNPPPTSPLIGGVDVLKEI